MAAAGNGTRRRLRPLPLQTSAGNIAAAELAEPVEAVVELAAAAVVVAVWQRRWRWPRQEPAQRCRSAAAGGALLCRRDGHDHHVSAAAVEHRLAELVAEFGPDAAGAAAGKPLCDGTTDDAEPEEPAFEYKM